MRSVVPAGAGPAGVRAGWQPAGAGSGVGLLPVAGRDDDLLAGVRRSHLRAVGGALPARGRPEGPGLGLRGAVGSWRRGRPQLTDAFNGFRGLLGFVVILNRPRDPESKGIVERANEYLETSFLPGRTFMSPQDFNAQRGEWMTLANGRFRRRLDCALPRDYYVRFALAPLAVMRRFRGPATARSRSRRPPR